VERFVTGDTGASKSGYATNRLLRCLAETDRYVVTNLALRWQPWIDGRKVTRRGLFALASELYPWADLDEWRSRVFEFPAIKSDPGVFGMIRWFFLYRPRVNAEGLVELARWEECLMQVSDRDSEGKVRQVQLFGCAPGLPRCHYIIDEAHEFFGAEEWSSLAKTHRSYVSQNRRAGDEVDLLTQVPGLVASPLRKLAVECHHLVNHSKLNWLIVKQPDWVTVRVYKNVDHKRGDPVLRWWVERGIRRYWEGYDSAAGAGVEGAAADFGEKSKGIPLRWFLVLVVFGVFFGLVGCQHGLRSIMRRASGAGAAVVAVERSGALVKAVVSTNAAGDGKRYSGATREPVSVRWFAFGHVGLSDGRVVWGALDPRLPGFVFADGQWRTLP